MSTVECPCNEGELHVRQELWGMSFEIKDERIMFNLNAYWLTNLHDRFNFIMVISDCYKQ
jgi:hypothetical protein